MTKEFLFVLLCLVVWRLTHLLSKEDGPFDIIYRLRKAIGGGFFGNLLDCFYCLSLWIALPFGLYIGTRWEKILYWLALSGAACLLEQVTMFSKYKKSDVPDYKED
jgi:Protein of unknown function (DUF1360)